MERPVKKITAEEHETLIETMRDNVDSQDKPKVGIFWYNPQRNRLVGIQSAYADELPFNAKGRKTVMALHHTTWPDVREDALANGSQDAIWQEEDYTMVPRGRVFQVAIPNSDAAYFEILAGSWLNDYPDAKALILKVFNLDEAEFDFIESHHWNIGRGTSEIFL
jgi:hypothetical protein